MKKSLKIILIFIFLLVLVFVLITVFSKDSLFGLLDQSSISQSMGTTSSDKILNNKAPSFNLQDNLGNRVMSSAYIDTPHIIVFWATYNEDSLNQLKVLDDYISGGNYNKLVSFLAINSQEEPSIVKNFIRRSGYGVPFALDITGDVSNSYGVKSLPVIYFIDRDGIVRDVYNGVLSSDEISNRIEQLLK